MRDSSVVASVWTDDLCERYCLRRRSSQPEFVEVNLSDRAMTGQIAFGPFRLLPARQLLLDGDKPVRLGSRACDILVALVERAGQLLSNRELIERVWPKTFVEEGNLRVHVAALRRALAD